MAADAQHWPDDRRLLLPLAAAHAGTYLALLPPTVLTLAVHVQHVDPDHRARTLSLVLAVGAVGGLLSQNIVGGLSDRTTSAYGRRKPWIFAGACGGTASLALLGAASSVPGLVLAWAAAVISYNTLLAGLGPLLAEQFPPQRHGFVAGVIAVAPPVAALLGVLMVTLLLPSVALALTVPAAIGAVGVGWLLLRLPDRRLATASAPRWRARELVLSFWTDPRVHRDFAWAWMSRLLVLLGSAALASYRPYFLQDALGVRLDDVPGVVLRAGVLSTVAAVVCGPATGRWSDRNGRRKVFLVVAGLLLAGTHAATAFAPNLTVFYAASVLGGAALGCYLSVGLALLTRVLPAADTAGKDMGVIHLATALPQVVVPLLAQPFLAVGGGGYRALYTGAAVAGLLGAVAVLRVRAAP